MSRPLTILLAVLCAGAIVAAVLVVGPASSSSSATTERTVTATKGVVQTTVSGSGNLAPAKQLDLNFGTSGTVTKVYVKTGDTVKQGQVLARLDDADAQVALDEAQASLDSAQADLDAAESGSTSTVADTGADQVTYLSVADTTTTEEAQTQTTTPPTTTTPAQTQTTPQQQTTTPTQTQTTQQQTQQTQQSAAPQSSSGSSGGSTQTAAQKAAAIATAQAAVDKAQLAVDDAEQAVSDTVLRAPTKGTVTDVTGAVGDAVSAGSSSASAQSAAADQSAGAQTGGTGASSSSSSAFVTLAKLDRMQLSVSFTESDIGQVKVGQPATVSLSALSDVKLSGKVTEVAQVGTSSSGVVSYPVTIVLDQNARGVKAGMTATAEVVVKQASGLTLPSQAVTGRGTTGIVQVKQDGATVSKQVGIGLQGDSSTIITSGLEAGDEVVIESTPAITGGSSSGSGQQSELSQRLSGGGGFPTGGFSSGGGFPTGGPPSGGGFARPGG